MKKFKQRSTAGKVFFIIFNIIFGLILIIFLTWAILNVAKYGIYKDYYKSVERVCNISGRSDKFIVQGLSNVDDKYDGEYVLTSGYTSNNTPSRIYLTSKKDDSAKYVTLTYNNEDLYGHFGGIAYVANGDVYIADDDSVLVLNIEDIYNAENKDKLEIKAKIPVNNSASFVYSDDNYLYVGEFYREANYKTDESHHFTVADQQVNKAIVSRYSFDKNSTNNYISETPNLIYSVTDQVQGFAIKDDKIYLSTSYGLASSKLYIYDIKDSIASNTLDGVDVIYVDDSNKVKTVTCPPMWEDLDIVEDRLYCVSESSSDKYIFGKLFFAYNVNSVSLDI